MTPRNPDFAVDIAASFARQAALATIGALLGEVAPGRCVVRLAVTDAVWQHRGFVHGGIVPSNAITDTSRRGCWSAAVQKPDKVT